MKSITSCLFMLILFINVFSKPISLDSRSSQIDKCRGVLQWLVLYNYYHHETLSIPIREMSIKACSEAVRGPLQLFKRFYKMKPVNGKITDEVLKMMNQPRCKYGDIPDDEESLSARNKRWTRLGETTWSEMPVTLSFSNYLTNGKISKNDQRTIMKECMNLWTTHSNLSMQVLKDGLYGDIDVEYMVIDGPFNVVGTGLSPTPFWPNNASYIRIDTSERWKARNEDDSRFSSVSLKWVMCHELGHALGIGHSQEEEAIMYAIGRGQSESDLHEDDRQAVQSLYGRPSNLEDSNKKPTPKVKLSTTTISSTTPRTPTAPTPPTAPTAPRTPRTPRATRAPATPTTPTTSTTTRPTTTATMPTAINPTAPATLPATTQSTNPTTIKRMKKIKNSPRKNEKTTRRTGKPRRKRRCVRVFRGFKKNGRKSYRRYCYWL